jgi:hypothetical protein
MRRELEELAVTYLVLLDCWNQSISIRYAASGSNAHGVEKLELHAEARQDTAARYFEDSS